MSAAKNARALRDRSLSDALTWVDAVNRAGDVALRMLLDGIFSIDDPSILDSAIETAATRDGDYGRVQKEADNLVRVLRATPLTKEQDQAVGKLRDLLIAAGIEFGEAGYVLGLAVGQRIDLARAVAGQKRAKGGAK